MEAERSKSVKRAPLSDRTNLIPSTTLRNLSSSSFVKLQNPNPISKPKPKPNPKPYNLSSNKPHTRSSKSDTGVGSSNSNNNAPSRPRTIPQPHLSTPPRVQSPHSSSTNPDNGNNEISEPLVVYSRRQTAEKRKYKGKAISAPFSCPPLNKLSNKGKAVAVPFSFSSPEKTHDKGKSVDVPVGCTPLEKTKNKGKAVVEPFSCAPLRTKNVWFTFCTDVVLCFTCLLNRDEHKEAGEVGLSKSCSFPHPKHQKKRRCLPPEQYVSKLDLPQDFAEQQRAYFKEVDEFELAEEEVSDIESNE